MAGWPLWPACLMGLALACISNASFFTKFGGYFRNCFVREISEIWRLQGEINFVLNHRKNYVQNSEIYHGKSADLALFSQ